MERPQFNSSVCPAFWELQAPSMDSFSLGQLPGMYYELALHDLTQYPLCPTKPACVSSNKTLRRHGDGVEYVNDAWNLECVGAMYPQTLLFNVTAHPGFFEAYVPATKVPGIGSTTFPDTIVDFKAGNEGWVLEFQCKSEDDAVTFVGINFYARQQHSETAFDQMLAAGKARGIDFFWNRGLGLSRVNQSACPPEPGERS